MPKVILHVEDEENDVFLLQHAMTKAGYSVPIQVATDGQRAIDYLSGTGDFANRDKFPWPSLVLLDLKLPHVPGLEVLKWIRQEAALLIPVVILSSSENEEDITVAYELGANAYLVKPSDMSQLPEIAKTIKDFWLTQNRPHPKPAGANRSARSIRQPATARAKVSELGWRVWLGVVLCLDRCCNQQNGAEAKSKFLRAWAGVMKFSIS
jgi:two-component system response regulator